MRAKGGKHAGADAESLTNPYMADARCPLTLLMD